MQNSEYYTELRNYSSLITQLKQQFSVKNSRVGCKIPYKQANKKNAILAF